MPTDLTNYRSSPTCFNKIVLSLAISQLVICLLNCVCHAVIVIKFIISVMFFVVESQYLKKLKYDNFYTYNKIGL
jgi:hypothetical protein